MEEVESLKPMEFLKGWLQTFSCPLDIITVMKDNDIKSTDVTAASVSLRNFFCGFNPQFYFTDNENLKEGVYQFLEQNHPDIIIVIPKKYDLFSGLFHKSRSKTFILHPRIPVLAIAG